MKFRNLVASLVGIALLFSLLWRADIGRVYAVVSSASMLVFLGFIVLITVISIKVVRWFYLSQLGLGMAARTYVLGQAVNEVFFMGSGELTRAFIARSQDNKDYGETLAAATVERIADTGMLVGLSILGVFMLSISGVRYQIFFPLGVVVLLALFLLKPNIILSIGGRGRRWVLLGRVLEKLERFASSYKASLQSFHSRKRMLVFAVFLTGSAWGVEAIGHKVVLLSIGQNVPYINILVIAASAWVLGAFSFLPGGLGVRDAVFSFLLGTQGVPLEVGVSAALIYRAYTYILLGFGSAFFLANNPIKK